MYKLHYAYKIIFFHKYKYIYNDIAIYKCTCKNSEINQMGTKTIYVKDEDEKLFSDAAKLGGISSIIAAALREYLAKHSDSSEKDDRTKLVMIQQDINAIKQELERINAKLGADEPAEQKQQAKGKRS